MFTAKTSLNEYSKTNEHSESKQEKTLRITPTRFPKPSEIISKQFKTIREDLEATQDKHDRDVPKANNIDNTLRTIEDYSNINTKQDVSDPSKIDMGLVIQDRGDLNKIKHNLDAFSLNRKETFVATPKFSFPRPSIYDTYSYSKANNYFNIKPYNEIKIPNMKISPVPKLHQTNFHNNRFIRELPKFQSDKLNFHKIPGRYFNKTNGNENVNELNDNKNNEIEKTQMGTNTENKKYKMDSIKHKINRNNFRFIQNRNAINRSYKKRGVNFPTPKYYAEKFNNIDQNHFIERNDFNDNNYYRIKQDYNDVSYRNYEKGSINSAIPNNFNKHNNQLNDRHTFNDNNVLNQNDNNVDYFNFHDISREINEKKKILDVLDKQNKLIERIAHRLLRERTIKPEEITWTDFDDIVNSLEARQNRTTITKSTTETTTKMSTVIALIDETEIREALKKDPFVKRILKMVNKRNGYNDKKLQGSIVVHNS